MYNRNYPGFPQADFGHDLVSLTPTSTTGVRVWETSIQTNCRHLASTTRSSRSSRSRMSPAFIHGTPAQTSVMARMQSSPAEALITELAFPRLPRLSGSSRKRKTCVQISWRQSTSIRPSITFNPNSNFNPAFPASSISESTSCKPSPPSSSSHWERKPSPLKATNSQRQRPVHYRPSPANPRSCNDSSKRTTGGTTDRPGK
ncbi:hypothetical protein BDV10DRAFT_34536 [Aspergillus recurvatus]